MIVEAVKQNGHFIIPYFDELNLGVDRVDVYIDDNVIQGLNNKSDTYKNIEKLNDELGGDEFLELKLKNMPKNFKYQDSGKTDKEIWYEERRAKYE